MTRGEYRMDCITEIRYFQFMAGVLVQQQQDPFCRACKAFGNSVRTVREGLEDVEARKASEISALPEEQAQLLNVARNVLSGLQTDPGAVGQKKTGNCRLPQGICFVKPSKALDTEHA